MLKWFSVGYLAEQLQCDVFDIYDAAGELEIEPVAQLNDIRYYDDAAVVRLRSRLAKGPVGFAHLKEKIAAQNAKRK